MIIVPESVASAARQEPKRLLRDPWDALERKEQARLSLPLQAWSDPTGGSPDGAWVGFSGSVDKPDHVVTGVCQGSNREEKQLWISRGPSAETVVGLDHAYRLAKHFDIPCHLWVVDHEYANVAAESGTAAQRLELEVGDALVPRLRRRYPNALIHRTSEQPTRANLYAAVTTNDVAELYPNGVGKPYGIASPSVWDQLDYLSCTGAFLVAGAPAERVWAVVDHDQYRAVAAAQVLRPSVSAAVYWPAPHLHWRRPDSRDPNVYLPRLQTRRMHRARCVGAKLFLEDSADDVRARARACGCEGGVSQDALMELARTLGEACASGDEDLLDRCLAALQSRSAT